MTHYSFSIRRLMIVVVILALAFAARRTPSRILANAWFSLVLGGIMLAMPAAAVTRGEKRVLAGFRGLWLDLPGVPDRTPYDNHLSRPLA
jgi:hypothetical protein